MEFGPSAEQRLFADGLRRMLAEVAPLSRVREVAGSKTGLDRRLWSELVSMGAVGVLLPERFGGSSLSLFDASIVAECLGGGVAPAPFLSTAVLAPIALLSSGTDAQQSALLPAIAAGQSLVGVGLSEVAARAVPRVELSQGKLHGAVRFVMDTGAADWFIIAVDADHLVLVAGDAPGLQRLPMQTLDRTRALAELRFDNTPCELIGEPEAAARTIRYMLSAARVLLAADTLGAGDEMIRQSVAYAKQRVQFDRVIASFQAVKHLCAEMVAEMEPCRSLVWYAGYAYDQLPQEAELMACHAKARLGDAGRFVARTATEVHGGMGFTDLLGLHYWFKRILLNRQLLGDPEQTRLEAARLQQWVE